MVDIAQQTMQGFLGGRQMAMQEEERGYLMEERAKKSAREEAVAAKQARIQGYLGNKEMTPQAREEAVFGEDVDLGKQMRDFRTDQEAENANLNASDAAVMSQAIGTPDEQSAVIWFADQLQQRGAPQEQIQPIMQQYQNASPEERSQLIKQVTDGFMARGMGAKDFLATKGGGKSLPTSGLKNVNMADGTQQSFDITDIQGRSDYQEAIAAGGKDAPTRQETAGPGGFGISKKEIADLREAEISTKNAIATADDLMARMEENPDLLQTAAGAAQFASGLGSEIRTAARVAGVDIPPEITNIAAYEDTFAELGIKNKIAKGLAFDLALSYAAASGLGQGRALTDKDIRLAMQRIGAGGFDTPAARMAAIKDVQRVLGRNFRTRYETIRGEKYTGDLGLKTKTAPKGVNVPESVGGINTADMPDGEEIRGPDGTYIKEGGVWRKK